MAFAGYLIRLRVNTTNHPEYLAAFMNTTYAKRILRNMCKIIIGMANINAKEVQKIRIAAPPKSLQDEFATRIQEIQNARSLCRASVVELDHLFVSLQYRVFRGEL